MQFILSKDKIQVECNTKSLLNLYCRKRSNVFPCAAVPTAIWEVARLRAEGVERQPRSGFSAKLSKLRR